jgi:hypothetical protein
MLKLVYGPGGEHDPGEDGVDEEEEGVGDTRGDTAGNLLALIMNFQDTDVEEHTCCRTSHKRYISQNMSPHRSRCLRIQEATQRLALAHRNISEHDNLLCRRSVRPKVAGSVKRPLYIMRPYTGLCISWCCCTLFCKIAK